MLKRVLEKWTRSLSLDDQARALAALVVRGLKGASEGREPLEKLILDACSGEPLSFRSWTGFEYQYDEGIALPASDLARAWLATAGRRPRTIRACVRIREEDLSPGLVEWLEHELRRPAAGIEGLFFETEGLRGPAHWRWPLRVGVPDGPDGDALVKAIDQDLRKHGWESLVRIERPSAGREKHDILLIPPLPELERSVLRLSRRHRAALVIACGSLPVHRWPALAEPFRASAMTMVESELAGWFISLLVELSHDQPLDLAFARAARWRHGVAPILLAERDFVEWSRLEEVRKRLIDRAEATRALVRGGMAEAMLVEASEGRWATNLAKLSYDGETHGATDVSRVGAEIERALATANRTRPARWLQARVLAANKTNVARLFPDPRHPSMGKEEFPVEQRFVRDRWHLLGVHVGAPRADAVRGQQAVPETSLQFRFGRETLGVVVAAPGCSVGLFPSQPWGPASMADFEQFGETIAKSERTAETAVDWIDLPEFGDSSIAWFAFRPHQDQVDARIMIVHENRVLQTALLTGPATSTEAEAADGKIELTTEAIVHRGLESLHSRRSFDAAFVINQGVDGRSRLTKVAGQRAELRDLGDTKALFDAISDQVGTLTDESQDFSRPDSEALRALLVDLANLGVALRRGIVEDTDLIEIAGATRLQIIAAKPEAFLPLEFVYDGDAPQTAAGLCPQRAAALAAGTCGECPNRTSKTVVCPTRFWGLNKVIERHVFTRPKKGDPDFAVIADPMPGDHRFRAPGAAVFAYSAKAALTPDAKVTLGDVASHLGVLTGQSCAPIDTWDDWRIEVKSLKPSILALVPHTERQGGVEALEIGTRQFLRAPQITAAEIGPGAPRLAILFGCSTADPTMPFVSFPANLRHAGVEITVGTLSPVLGRHAAPSMRDFVDCLAAAWKQKNAIPLAELMAKLRRGMIAKGLPFGLTIVAYGDADWTFGG